MEYAFDTTPVFDKEFKKLYKKYKSIKDDIKTPSRRIHYQS
ncbi:hypothetical protein SAMN05444369_10520 [Capnocytophaga haemolytica]|jgi:hypothetical protein|uniref:Uncharacterized protein n=1 Tax=Capnocytophaga haemolytica TaxID=45243 RepID=A0AAX2GZ19_9FLAO|nr:hypothetical protein SAMN05444369_10520 [Capnocytophaga haemolytica]SNV12929.1 Uncharacterised protein [Capnocytophaga haemolytica]